MVVDCPRLTSVNCKSRNFLTSAYSFVERYSTASADPHSELYQRAKPHPFLHGQRRQPLLRSARRHLLLRPFTVNEDNHLAMRVVTCCSIRLFTVNEDNLYFAMSVVAACVERYPTASADPHSELYQRAKPHPFLHGQRRQPLLRSARRHLLLRPFTVNEDNHLAMRVVTASVNVTQQLLQTHILSLSEGETKRTSCLFRSYCKMTFQCRHVCCHRRPPYLATRIVTCLPFRSLQDE